MIGVAGAFGTALAVVDARTLGVEDRARIARAAERRAVRGPDDPRLSARPRWPLDTASAPMLGSGRKGAKA